MVGKFSFLFLLAFVASQASGYLIVPQEEPPLSDGAVVFGVWEKVNEIVDKIKEGLSNMKGLLGNLFSKLKGTLKDMVKDLDIKKLVTKVKDSIKKLLGQAGKKVDKCIDAQSEDIKKLANQMKDATMACVNKAKDEIQAVKDLATQIKEKGAKFMEDVKNVAWKCIKDNATTPNKIMDCFKEQVKPVTKLIKELKDHAVQFLNDAKNVMMNSTKNLGTCVFEEAKGSLEQQKAIMLKIKDCVLSKENTLYLA